MNIHRKVLRFFGFRKDSGKSVVVPAPHVTVLPNQEEVKIADQHAAQLVRISCFREKACRIEGEILEMEKELETMKEMNVALITDSGVLQVKLEQDVSAFRIQEHRKREEEDMQICREVNKCRIKIALCYLCAILVASGIRYLVCCCCP